jgi:hypothetical protein
MIDMSAHTNFDGSRLTRIVAEGSGKAVVRAAAYLRGVAKRKVRRRKHVSSPEGSPPYAHSGVFKASILFGVDAAKTTAVIGPERLVSGRTNRSGQTVPGILEYGGMAALGMNALWIHRRVPRGVNDLSGIAAYFRSIGRGPIAYGGSPTEADAKVSGSDNRKRKFARHPRRWSPVLKRKVYLTYIPIATDVQARKVAKTVVDVFGYPVTNRPIRIAARPLMAPTLAENREKVSAFWRNLT